MQSARREYVSTRITSADAEDPLYENHRCRSVDLIGLIASPLTAGHDRQQRPETGKGGRRQW